MQTTRNKEHKMTSDNRTWEDFAEEMFDKGCSKKHVLGVCLGSRWWPHKAEIIQHIKNLRKIFKKSKK